MDDSDRKRMRKHRRQEGYGKGNPYEPTEKEREKTFQELKKLKKMNPEQETNKQQTNGSNDDRFDDEKLREREQTQVIAEEDQRKFKRNTPHKVDNPDRFLRYLTFDDRIAEMNSDAENFSDGFEDDSVSSEDQVPETEIAFRFEDKEYTFYQLVYEQHHHSLLSSSHFLRALDFYLEIKFDLIQRKPRAQNLEEYEKQYFPALKSFFKDWGVCLRTRIPETWNPEVNRQGKRGVEVIDEIYEKSMERINLYHEESKLFTAHRRKISQYFSLMSTEVKDEVHRVSSDLSVESEN